jgi:hypothetical protein
MTLKEQILADQDIFYNTDDFAESVVYTPHEGAPKTIPALISYGSGEEGQGADRYGVRATVRIKAGDVAEPNTRGRDALTVGTVEWTIIGAERSASGLEWILQVNRKTV